jgi:WD40 repeat protein
MKHLMILVILLLSSLISVAQDPPQLGEPLATLDLNTQTYGAEASEDGLYIALATETGVKIVTSNLQLVASFYDNQKIAGVAWHPNNTQLAVAHSQQVDIWSWNAQTAQGQLFTTLTLEDVAIGVYWRPDGSQLAVLSRNPIVPLYYYEEFLANILFWDTSTWQKTGQAVYDYVVKQQWINSDMLAWIPNSSIIAGVGNMAEWEVDIYTYRTNPVIFFIDSNTGELVRQIELMGPLFYAIAINRSGTQIAIGDDIGVENFDLLSGQQLYGGPGTSPTITLAFSPDGRYVTTDSVIVDLNTNEQIANTLSLDYDIVVWNIYYKMFYISNEGKLFLQDLSTLPALVLPTAIPSATPTP